MISGLTRNKESDVLCSEKCYNNKEKHSFERGIIQMIGSGTIINTIAIIAGGVIGIFNCLYRSNGYSWSNPGWNSGGLLYTDC